MLQVELTIFPTVQRVRFAFLMLHYCIILKFHYLLTVLIAAHFIAIFYCRLV